MDISVFYDHIIQAGEQTERSADLLISEIKEDGISAFEINLTYLLGHQEIYSLILQKKMKISCIYEFYDLTGYDGTKDAGRTPEGRAKCSYADLVQHIETAAKTGAEKILVVPGFLSEKEAAGLNGCTDKETVHSYMDDSPAICNMRDALADAVRYAEKYEISVTLEDFDDLKAPYGTPYQLMWFMEKVPGLKLTFDTGNFALQESDVLEAYGLLRKYIVHVHCKDRGETANGSTGMINRGMAVSAVGDGYIPVADIVRGLKQSGYDSYLAVEHFDAPDQMGYIKRSCENIKRFLD